MTAYFAIYRKSRPIT